MMWSSLSCGLVMSSGNLPADWLHHISCLCSWGFANYLIKKKKATDQVLWTQHRPFQNHTWTKSDLLPEGGWAASSFIPHASWICHLPSLSDCFILNFLIRKKGSVLRWRVKNREGKPRSLRTWGNCVRQRVSRDEKSRWGNSRGV